MISFKEFLDQFNKKYVALGFTEETEKNLYDYALDNGFDLTINYDGGIQDSKDFKFHTTVFYSSTYHNMPDNTIILENPIILKPKRLALLGQDKNIPVIELEATDALLQLREIFKSQGMGDQWNNYIPHISLSYVKDKYPIEKMSIPAFNIVANSFSISNQS